MPRIDLTDLQHRDFAFGFHARRREEGGQDGLPGGELREAWDAVAEVLGLCRDGDFSGLPRLAGLMTRVEGYLYRSAIVNIVGCAGGWGLIERFVAGLEGVIPDHEAHKFGARTLSLSCHAAAVNPLLRLYPKAHDLDGRLTVSHQLSFLLEEGPGPIWMGADEEEGEMGPGVHARIEEYADLLRDVVRAMSTLPTDAPAGPRPPETPGRCSRVPPWTLWERPQAPGAAGGSRPQRGVGVPGIADLRGGHGRGLHTLLDPRLRAAAPRRDGDRGRVPRRPRGWPLRAWPPLLLRPPSPELRRDRSSQILDLGGFEDRSLRVRRSAPPTTPRRCPARRGA